MALIKKRKNRGAEVPSSGMADIAFLLLVFFIVATTIDVDTGIGLSLPEYIPPEEIETVEVSKDRMAALLINENGEILLDGKVVAVAQIKENLKPRITERIDMQMNKKLIVSLKTDRKTTYNRYVQALDQVKLAFFEVQDEYATSAYGRKIEELDKEVQNEIKKSKVPIIISIAEPEKINEN